MSEHRPTLSLSQAQEQAAGEQLHSEGVVRDHSTTARVRGALKSPGLGSSAAQRHNSRPSAARVPWSDSKPPTQRSGSEQETDTSDLMTKPRTNEVTGGTQDCNPSARESAARGSRRGVQLGSMSVNSTPSENKRNSCRAIFHCKHR